MASKDAEESVFRAASAGLKRWLKAVRDKVMTPWHSFKGQPDASAIRSTVPIWQAEVERILAALTPALREGWVAADLPGDYDPQDPYIQSALAMTRNLLLQIPDEVHALIVSEIMKGADAGESTSQIAARVDDVLDYSGSQNWPNRAMVIAVTESTRHRNSAMLAHALSPRMSDNRVLMKRWDTNMDGRERPAHHAANKNTVPLAQPFIVDNEPLLYPGDPQGHPDNVCGCRCDLALVKVTNP